MDMDIEEAFKVEWEQLPQRKKWLESKAKHRPRQPGRSVSSDPKGTPHQAATPAAKQAGGWEYLDHTADVQVHAWGANVGEAYGAAVVGMYGYMVELEQISNDLEMEIESTGHDRESLLFNFMDDCLYIFHTESFVMKEIIVESVDESSWKLKAVARGGLFDVSRHTQGTEVKAITYSNMQIVQEGEDKVDVFVIVDI